MTWTTLALVLQATCLLHQDAFTYTQPYVNRFYLSCSNGTVDPRRSWSSYDDLVADRAWTGGCGPVHFPTEANAISAWFQQRGLFPVYVVGCTGALVGTTELLSELDHDHLRGSPVGTKDLFLAAVTLLEIDSIHTWAKQGYGPPEVRWTLWTMNFS